MRRERDDRRPPLDRLIAMGATDLTARAQTGLLSRAFGRDHEIEQMTHSLLSRQSVLLLGAAEVGKTAILHELINRTVWKQGPDELHAKRVVSISTGGILAGTEYLGDWQTRLTDLLEAVKQDGNIYLYIEDIWGLRDAGRASDKADGFATLIRPYLERQEVIVLGESTPENFASGASHLRGLSDEPSLLKCFNVVRVEATSVDATKRILLAVARHLQRTHKVRIEATAIERGLELTRRFLPYQAFPGKAVRLLEETVRANGADTPRDHIKPPAPGEAVIGADAISAGFSRMTGLPEKIISDRIALTQADIRAYFDERVIGQEEAIAAVLDLVTLIKAELHDPNRPLGVLFFVGPTGVGKTELAKTLAEYLFGSKDKLLRFDMSEFKTYSALDDLLAQLTEKQRQQSFSVLLLDEIEKAGPFVFDLFLSAFDDARLTDASGRSVDLHNTIVVMTSNLGSDLVQERPARAMGFVEAPEAARSAAERRREALIEVVKGHFRPEFINRLDKIVTFQPLGMEAMRRIARRELGKALLREGVLRRNILLDFRDEVLDVLLTVGFSPTYGARPLQRAIKDEVLLPLARRIAAQPGVGEQLLELCVHDGRIETQMLPPEPLAELPAGERVRAAGHDAGRDHARDLRQLSAELGRLHERVEAHISSTRYRDLQTQVDELLREVGQPAFWDDRDRSRRTLSTIYRLEQVTDRFTDLRNRVEGLSEMAAMIHQHGDVAGPRELASKFEALEGDVLLAELELVAGDQDAVASDAAFVCVTPLSVPRARDASEWAESLRAMYLAWAQRKGYDAEAINEPGTAPVVVIRGPNVYRMLQGEHGIHKLHREGTAREPLRPATRGASRASIHYARVEVLPSLPDELDVLAEAPLPVQVTVRDLPGAHAQAATGSLVEATATDMDLRVRVRATDARQLATALLRARLTHRPKGATLAADDELARVYYLTRSQHVRDPRTEQRLSRPREVLAGEIDPFLVAWLSTRRPDTPTSATDERLPTDPGQHRATARAVRR